MRDLPLLKYNWFILLWVEIRESQIIFITLFFFSFYEPTSVYIFTLAVYLKISYSILPSVL